MGKNIYLNIVVTLLFAALIVFGIAGIRALDLMRIRIEKLSDGLSALEAKVGNLSALPRQEFVSPTTASESAPLSVARAVAPQKMANSEFFDKNAVRGDRFVCAVSSDSENMNYLINNDAFVAGVWDFVNDSLATRNYKDIEKFEPQLAESWSLSDDKTTWTIKLKQGVFWHDFKDPVSKKEWKNVPVTANDFKFYFDVIMNPDTDCAPMRSYFADIESVTVISDYEFQVKWKNPYFKADEITFGFSPLPRHLYHAYEGPFDPKKFNEDTERNRLIVGCGAYKFERWDKNQRLVLRRFDNYYGERYGAAPAIEYVSFEVIQHPNTRFQALTSKDIDQLGLVPDQWVNRTGSPEFVGKDAFLKKIKMPGKSYSYIGYDLKNPLFEDKRVRQALASLVDKDRIIKDVYFGLARSINGPFLIDAPYYDKTVKGWPFSVEKAKALMAEAGWKDTNNDGILDKDGKKFDFTIVAVVNNPVVARLLPLIKEDMAKAGIVLTIQYVEWPVLIQKVEERKFEAFMLGWALPILQDPYQLWHSSQADAKSGSNYVNFKNPEADAIIEKIRVCFDVNERIKLCHKLHQIINEEQPYTFLFTPDSLSAWNDRYKNMQEFPVFGIPTNILWTPKDRQMLVPSK